jgi:hypothetical protein
MMEGKAGLNKKTFIFALLLALSSLFVAGIFACSGSYIGFDLLFMCFPLILAAVSLVSSYTSKQTIKGFAINLIVTIAIYCIVLFAVGLFTINNTYECGADLGTSCIGQPGFSCSSPAINQTGILSFTLGQGTEQTIYDLKLACVSSANSVAVQNLAYQAFNQSSVAYGETVDVKGLQCYPYGGSTKGMLSPIGTAFTGVIWSTYATSPGGTAQYIKIATVAVKSSS